MADRIPSDHPTIDTHRARIARSGGTRRPCLRLPGELGVADGDLVRVVVDDDERHAVVAADTRGPLLRGAFGDRALARDPGAGENHLRAWLDGLDRGPGDSVALDVVEPGDCYGLRRPGERTVYAVAPGPDDSLASIAEELGGSETNTDPF